LLVVVAFAFQLVNAQYQSCQVSYNGKSFDFSPLREQNDYIITTSNGTVWINMCGPLTDADIIQQFPGSSAALQSLSQTYQSLGQASSLAWNYATIDSKLAIIANYSGGSNNLSYSIVFKCDQNAINDGKGQPILDQITNNQFIFNWTTSFACSAGPGDCFVNYEQYTIDLTPLRGTSDYKVAGMGNTTYFLNICGPLADNSVCTNISETVGCQINGPTQVTIGISDASSFYFNATGKNVIAGYYGGTEGRRLVYQLDCDQTNGVGTPVYVNEYPPRTYNFYWKTNVVCIQNK